MSKTSFYTQLTSNEQYILKCCFFVFAINGVYVVMLGSLLPLISSEYSLSNTISGSLLSAHQVGNLAAGFIAGILPVYLGRKKAILFLCSFVAVGFIIMMTTGNPVWLLLGFLFIGISRGSISNFNNTVVNEVSDSNPAALSLLHSIFAIGALTAPFIVILSMRLGGVGGWCIATGFVVFLVILAMGFFSRMKLDNTARRKGKITSYEFMKNRNFQVDKVTGLDGGADDYITKPFAIEELLARIRAALRKKNPPIADAHVPLQAGLLKLDPERREAWIGTNPLDLTKREFDLLQCLLENKNIVMKREVLLDKIWGYDFSGGTNAVDVYVRYLRAKIEEPYHQKIILTVRGVGYVIRDE